MRIYDDFSPAEFANSINKRLLAAVILEKKRREAKRTAVEAINRYWNANETCAVREADMIHVYKS